MHPTPILLVLTAFGSLTTAHPSRHARANGGNAGGRGGSGPQPKPSGGFCDSVAVRRDWKDFSRDEKRAFVQAVQCLMQAPTMQLNPNWATASLYEDFTQVHNEPGQDIHHVAPFAPWHRWFIWLFLQRLKSDCGYTGELPYWSWDQDWRDLSQSYIWDSDPEVGFGTFGSYQVNNALNGSAITDGAFGNRQITYPFPHPFQRDLRSALHPSIPPDNGLYFQYRYNETRMSQILALDNYFDFRNDLEGEAPAEWGGIMGPHDAIHLATGGDLSSGVRGNISSPNDPLFYLHHANVDRFWKIWQSQGSNRLFDYSGNTMLQDPIAARIGTASLDDPLFFPGLMDGVTVRDAMDTTAYPLCYTYGSLDVGKGNNRGGNPQKGTKKGRSRGTRSGWRVGVEA